MATVDLVAQGILWGDDVGPQHRRQTGLAVKSLGGPLLSASFPRPFHEVLLAEMHPKQLGELCSKVILNLLPPDIMVIP